MTELRNRWALITGAAGGIGLGTARAFAKRGCNVIITDLNAAGLDAAATELRALGVRCLTALCDVGDANAVAACAQQVADAGVVPDVVVNNAGVAYIGGFMETPVEQWQRILNINVLGCVLVTRAFLPAMLAAGGDRRIVNIASTASYLPAPNMSAYAASKGAVKSFSEVLALDLADTPIRVQCVYPGVINTAIIGGIRTTGANISEQQLASLQAYYLKAGVHPDVVGEDIAKAVIHGDAHVYTGPMSLLGNVLSRLSPALARRVTRYAARRNGYLPAE